MLPWHQYLFGLIFVFAGFIHLQKPAMYHRIIPPYIPNPKLMVLLSGVLEMILGFMLLNIQTTVVAAWGIILLMLLFLPVHFYMLYDERASLKLPKWVLLLRLPLQFGLIYWAYQYV